MSGHGGACLCAAGTCESRQVGPLCRPVSRRRAWPQTQGSRSAASFVLSNSLPRRTPQMARERRERGRCLPGGCVPLGKSLGLLSCCSNPQPHALSQDKQWASFKGPHSQLWDFQPSWAIEGLLLSPEVSEIEVKYKRKSQRKHPVRNHKCWIRSPTLALLSLKWTQPFSISKPGFPGPFQPGL